MKILYMLMVVTSSFGFGCKAQSTGSDKEIISVRLKSSGMRHIETLSFEKKGDSVQVVKETFSSHSEGIISAAEFEPLATAIAQGKFKNKKRSPWLLDGVDCSLSFKYMQNGELKSEKYTSGGTCIYKDIFNKAHEIIDPYIGLWKNNAGENAKE